MSTDDFDFFTELDDIGRFLGPGTRVASSTSALIATRRHGDVEWWIDQALTALRDDMRGGAQPPCIEAILQAPTAVRHIDAAPWEEMDWFIRYLKRRAARLPAVWVAMLIPDLSPYLVPADQWDLSDSPPPRVITHAWSYVEVRGRGLGLPRGTLIRTGRVALDDRLVDLTDTDDAWVRRIGRRILHGHPVRRR